MNKEFKKTIELLRNYIKENSETVQAKDIDLSSLSKDELKQLQAKTEQERRESELIPYT